jgi:hypothetical protein
MTRYRTEATLSLEFVGKKSAANTQHEQFVHEMIQLVRGMDEVTMDVTTEAVKDSKTDVGTTHYEGPV